MTGQEVAGPVNMINDHGKEETNPSRCNDSQQTPTGAGDDGSTRCEDEVEGRRVKDDLSALVGVERAVKQREVEDEAVGDYLTAKCTVGKPRWASGLWSAVMPSVC